MSIQKKQDYFAKIEAILFASGEPVAENRLAAALEISPLELRALILDLIEEYQQDIHGIQIVQLEESYQFCTKQQYESEIKSVLELKRNIPLSQAAMETLAIIAYNQPVTRSFIEQVRGVDSSSIVSNLQEKELIEEAGRLEIPGRPIAYRTTEVFLRSFQMNSLQDLPELPEIPVRPKSS